MKRNEKYYKTLLDFDNPGKVKDVECVEHSYAWSGEMPCTGVYCCVFCGKVKDEGEVKA